MTRTARTGEPLTPLRDGCRVTLTLAGTEADVDVTCTDVDQRNWSRVAQGVAPGLDSGDLFLKQFIDRGGVALSGQFGAELVAHPLAGEVLGRAARVPAIVAVGEAALTVGYEQLDMLPMDTLLRSDPTRFEREFPRVLATVQELLGALQEVDGSRLLPDEIGDGGHGARALAFKGLDIRNLAVAADSSDARDVFIFDFGKAYAAPIAEAAARFLVSIALLNWGRPLSRFARGPDVDLLRAACVALARFTDLDASLYRLRQEAAYRAVEVKSGSRLEHLAKTAGIKTLGGRYVAAVEGHLRTALE